jgi:hypothetical protein
MSKIFNLIILILYINCCCGQNKLDYGKVQNDSQFNCNNNFNYSFEKNSICNSKNELEIRLYAIGFPHGNHIEIILTYRKKWIATRYVLDICSLNDTITKTIQEDTNLNNYKLANSHIFDSLKANNIFLLPNQYELNIKRTVLDGAGYILTFKIGNKYRTYKFNNPESYANSHPEIKEFRQYANIARLMFALFEK